MRKSEEEGVGLNRRVDALSVSCRVRLRGLGRAGLRWRRPSCCECRYRAGSGWPATSCVWLVSFFRSTLATWNARKATTCTIGPSATSTSASVALPPSPPGQAGWADSRAALFLPLRVAPGPLPKAQTWFLPGRVRVIERASEHVQRCLGEEGGRDCF